jgi:hypothetical protein
MDAAVSLHFSRLLDVRSFAKRTNQIFESRFIPGRVEEKLHTYTGTNANPHDSCDGMVMISIDLKAQIEFAETVQTKTCVRFQKTSGKTYIAYISPQECFREKHHGLGMSMATVTRRTAAFSLCNTERIFCVFK